MTAAMLLSPVPAGGTAVFAEPVSASGKCGENLNWEVSGIDDDYNPDLTLTISGTGEMEDYYFNEAPWSGYDLKIKKIVLPDGLTRIGSCAFSRMGIETVSIPSSVTSIEYAAFQGCPDLEKVAAEGLVKIGDSAFNNCKALKEFDLPQGLLSIGDLAFDTCNSLTEIKIPSSVNDIDDTAFRFCTSLNKISVDEGNPSFDSRENCNALINTETGTLIKGCDTTVIPEGVKKIGDLAFSDCLGIKEISFPDSLTSIGTSAFRGCSSLEGLSIGAGVSEIGDNAFFKCTGLTSIEVSEDNPVYDSRENSNALIHTEDGFLIQASSETDTVPEGVKKLGVYSFSGLPGPKTVKLPSSLETIEDNAFSDCHSLEEITIPNSVTDLGVYAFSSCYKMKKITLSKGLTELKDRTFQNCQSLSFIEIPDSVNEIGQGLFAGCKSLRSIILPLGITEIKQNTFGGCMNLSSVNIPDGVSAIRDGVFSNCYSLRVVGLPKSLKTINEGAFDAFPFMYEDPNRLSKVYYEGNAKDWEDITIGNGNDPLTNANIIYNSSFPDKIEPEFISLDEKEYKLPIGSFAVFRANVNPWYAESDEITWSSDNEEVASVDENGKVTAKTTGKASITARTGNGKTDTCAVMVVSSPEEPSLDPGTNVSNMSYGFILRPVTSYLFSSDGGYMVLRYTSPNLFDRNNGNIAVLYFDGSYNLVSKRQIPDELPLWGGFYASDDSYYIVTGQENPEESDSVECFRVTRYDHEWNRLGSAPLYNCNTTLPFDAGSCRMALSGDYLLVRTCRQMYTFYDGLRHQSNVTFLFDKNNMEICDSMMEVDSNTIRYVSHSFNQYVLLDDGIVTFDHGDAYPRAAVIGKSWQDISEGILKGENLGTMYGGKPPKSAYVNALHFSGNTGNNYTAADSNGLVAGSDRYLVAGSSVIQDEEYIKRRTRNIFVASTDKELEKLDINWITSYKEGEKGALAPQLVDMGNDRFLLLWQLTDQLNYRAESKTVYYTLVNAHGEKISDTYSHAGELSDCAPVVINGEARWFTVDGAEVAFYGISTEDVTKFTSYNFIDEGAENLPEEYREAEEKARMGTMLTETKEVSGRTVSVNYTGWTIYDRRTKRETDGSGKKRSKNTKSKDPSVSINILIDGQTVPPELITYKFKNNKRAAYMDAKKPPYFDITVKRSPENGIDPEFASKLKKAFKGKNSLRFNIIPASLSGADTEKVAAKTKIKNGKIKKTGGLRYLFDYGDKGTKTVTLKYDKTGKSRSKDYTASYDPEKNKLTVSGQNNYIGSRMVDL